MFDDQTSNNNNNVNNINGAWTTVIPPPPTSQVSSSINPESLVLSTSDGTWLISHGGHYHDASAKARQENKENPNQKTGIIGKTGLRFFRYNDLKPTYDSRIRVMCLVDHHELLENENDIDTSNAKKLNSWTVYPNLSSSSSNSNNEQNKEFGFLHHAGTVMKTKSLSASENPEVDLFQSGKFDECLLVNRRKNQKKMEEEDDEDNIPLDILAARKSLLSSKEKKTKKTQKQLMKHHKNIDYKHQNIMMNINGNNNNR